MLREHVLMLCSASQRCRCVRCLQKHPSSAKCHDGLTEAACSCSVPIQHLQVGYLWGAVPQAIDM